jgi:hypothetical protein
MKMYKEFIPSPINYIQTTTTIVLILTGLYLAITVLLNKNYLSIGLQKISPNNFHIIIKVICVIIGLAAIYQLVLTPSHTFLTFLDRTVLPPSILLLSEQKDTNVEIKIDAPGAIKVVYWAAKEDDGKVIMDPQDAYGDYENVGISAVKKDRAILKLKCPTTYKVMKGRKQLPKHVHFRLIYANGVLSEVRTLKLDTQCPDKISKNIEKIEVTDNDDNNHKKHNNNYDNDDNDNDDNDNDNDDNDNDDEDQYEEDN